MTKTDCDYCLTGFMIEKLWKYFPLFANFENLVAPRHTNFDVIYTGRITNPLFRDVYPPAHGVVLNGGIKMKL